MIKQLNSEQAIKIYNSKAYQNWTNEKIVRLQLFQDRLCVPFDMFLKAISEVLNRDVFSHEFSSSNRDSIMLEYLGEKEPPTFDEVLALIPKDKLIMTKSN